MRGFARSNHSQKDLSIPLEAPFMTLIDLRSDTVTQPT
ncbi:MAG: hypothetical protein K0S85_2744, partial [Pseudomonas orientalis]|nr:hypothetical protein [Pseudomonas orientalis]